MFRKALLIGLLSTSGCHEGATTPASQGSQTAPVAKKAQLSEDEQLGGLILLQMDIVHADLSTMRRQVLARTLVRVTGEIFTDFRHREAFIGIVAQEAHFSATAKSPAGAVGISQVMPQYAGDFARLCGLSDFKPTDLQDVELNLYLGACAFRDLLEKLDGNTVSAKLAYNAGYSSASLKSLLAQRNVDNKESSNYPTQIAYKSEEARNAQEKIETTGTMEITKKTLPVNVSIEGLRTSRPNKKEFRVVYTIKNQDETSAATGTTIVIGTFRTKDGKVIYITNPPILGDQTVMPDLLALSKQSLPFSIKKVKQYELSLVPPKDQPGDFESVKIITTDARTGGQSSMDVPLVETK